MLTLVQYKAEVDAAGTPVKDANGRFVKGDLIALTVMEKRAGFGTEYPPELRNGDWEYAAFSGAGVLNEKANYKACFECHKPHEKIDYVISLAAVRGAAAPTMAPKPDVKITGFAFGPNKLAGTVGQPVTWVNEDDSPHQITVVSTKERSPILTKGQSAVLAFVDRRHLRLHLWAASEHEGHRRGQVAPKHCCPAARAARPRRAADSPSALRPTARPAVPPAVASRLLPPPAC